jgi:uncharacterized delta-60 repeat protein
MNTSVRCSLTLGLFLAACGDNPKPLTPDSAVPMADAAIDTAPAYVQPAAVLVPLSDKGPDQLQAVTAAPDGKFYAAGFFAVTAVVGAPRTLVVIRVNADGSRDATFGNGGLAAVPQVNFKGGTDEIDIATQTDGKIVVTATVASPANPDDHDIAVVRLTTAGGLDNTFNEDGIAIVDLNTGVLNNAMPPVLTGLDASRGLAVSDAGIFVHAVSRALGTLEDGTPRLDTDYTVVKLTLNGQIDESFGDQSATGKKSQFRLDILGSSATARAIKALPDGKLLAGGYASSTATGNTTQPVIYKLTAEGKLDDTFADHGLFHDVVLTLQTEVYNFAIHGDKFVTGGYGRNEGTTNDWISLRFDLNTGVRDTTWGGAGFTDGKVFFDPSGTKLGSNCRGAFALPDGKTLLLGSMGPGNMPAQDAVFVILDATGKLDTAYGTGLHKYKLGVDGNDQFWGAAVSGTKVAVVGWKGGGAAADQTETTNDDSFRVVFDLK